MASRIYRVVISDEARNMLCEHISFLARVNLSAAKILRGDLLSRIKSLGKTPRIHPIFYSDSLETEYRKLIYKRYIVLYSINEPAEIVCVKFVWDSRKNNKLE